MNEEQIISKIERFSLQEKVQYISTMYKRKSLVSPNTQKSLTKIKSKLETQLGGGSKNVGRVIFIYCDSTDLFPGKQPKSKEDYKNFTKKLELNPYAIPNTSIRLPHLYALAGNWERAGELYSKSGDLTLAQDAFIKAGNTSKESQVKYNNWRKPILTKQLARAEQAHNYQTWLFSRSSWEGCGGEHKQSARNIRKELSTLD